jgi:DNA-3-methyladenine glycosylase I
MSDDGRCPWGTGDPVMAAYHDEEWGRPVRSETGLYERMCLEAFQSGLSWRTILNKRPAFRKAFADFDVAAVAEFGDDDFDRLMADAGIVRNRAKILAAITNARATLALDGDLPDLVWSHAPARGSGRAAISDVPGSTPESVALSKALKKRGFVFVGPTTAYAMMQACGLVNDHLATCPAWEACERAYNEGCGTSG